MNALWIVFITVATVMTFVGVFLFVSALATSWVNEQ